ncbi:MAG: hypothetical protein AB3N14_02590 [Flavobacteriaceae bacterium]
MKKLLGLVFLTFILVSATTYNASEPQAKPSIEGTWELMSFYNYDEEGNVTDTIPTVDGYRQIKMFYNGKIMWTRYVPQDSVEWFGYGSYETTDSTLTEKLEYMSASIRKIAPELLVWNMELILKADSYTQIFIDADGNRVSSENYRRLD